MRPPSPGGAALRSALVPGWGQWAAGRRRRGAVLAGGTLALAAAAALVALAPVGALLPLPERVRAAAGGLSVLELAALERLAVSEWASMWRAAVAANVLAGLLRAWAALDAAGWARHAARQAALVAAPAPVVGAGLPVARTRSRRAGPVVREGGPAGPGAGGALGAAAGALATCLVVGPHAGLVAAGYTARPLLSQVLVPQGQPANPAAAPAPAAAAAAEAEASRPTWDGSSRLNVLLLGTDRRPQEAAERPWGNSDTILLVSLGPGARSAAMISVPRDVYLEIPGVGPEKINAAYREGGPALVVGVVSDLLGVPVHRWASIDVAAFARVIDALGGVVVDIERPIRDDAYPAENYAIRRILLPAGLQWLDGERALWYARSRHESTDFDRAARQQRLLLSLKERARDPRTLARLPALINSLAEAVQTDVSPREALALARLAAAADVRSVSSLVLAPPTYGRVVAQPSLYAVLPDRPRIQAAVAEVLAAGPGTGTAAPAPVPSLVVVPLGDAPEPGPGQGGRESERSVDAPFRDPSDEPDRGPDPG